MNLKAVNLDGVFINHRCMGKGRDVVLIHGLAANQGFWTPGILLPLARNYRVTLIDLRGHGYSTMPPSGYTSGHMADDVCQLMDDLGISHAHLVGHSYGGSVALQCAVRCPTIATSITVADTRVRALQPTQRAKDWPNWQDTQKQLADWGLQIPDNETEAGLWFLENLALHQWHQARETLEGCPVLFPLNRRNGRNRSAERWLKLLATTTAKEDFLAPDGLTPERIAAIQAPVLGIYGEYSPVLPSALGLTAQLPNFRQHIVSGGGHFFPVTHPAPFLNTLLRFLSNVDLVERRDFERFELRWPVGIKGYDMTTFVGDITNASQSGLLLESPKNLEKGAQVELVVMPNRKRPLIRLGAVIVRAVVNGTGNAYHFGMALKAGPKECQAWEVFLSQR